MRVLVACEFSGVVRDEFAKLGHDAWSCDLLTTDSPGNHIHGNVLDHLDDGWDLMIAHPPCTYLANSGARWWSKRKVEQDYAIGFVEALMDTPLDNPIQRIAIENPIGILSTKIRKPDQIVQPWMFGHGETKATCLWLKNLPELKPTNIVEGREPKCWKAPDSKGRWKRRSITYQGIAEAMAAQWGTNCDRA